MTSAETTGDLPASVSPLGRRLTAEALGTGFLLAAVVGSGILGQRLAGGDAAVALLVNALTTAAVLFALIECLGPVSGAHLNPVVTAVLAVRGDISRRIIVTYIPAQVLGAVLGVAGADTMFGEPVLSLSAHVRHGPAQLLGEFISTFGLVGAVWACSRARPSSTAGVVAAYVGGAFWFTPTGFANPAVTIARAFTSTAPGIRPADVPGFVAAEIVGAAAAALIFSWLMPNARMGTAPGQVTRGRGNRSAAAGGAVSMPAGK